MTGDQLDVFFRGLSDSPNGADRLRRLVLGLAVRGRLVRPDSDTEGSADALLRELSELAPAVRAQFRQKHVRPTADSVDGTAPFDISANWVWCRLSNVGAIVGGGTPPSADARNFAEGGTAVAWLTPADLGKHEGLYVAHGRRDLTTTGLATSSATVIPPGSVLFTSRAPIGYTAIASNEISTNQGFKSVVPFLPELNRYIEIYLRAFAPWIEARASGTTFREAPAKLMVTLPFPLPPLAEQRRIAARVDQLMEICSEHEAARRDRETLEARFSAASAGRIQSACAGGNESVREDVAFHLRHVPRLTKSRLFVKDTRDTITSLAVGGWLAERQRTGSHAAEILDALRVKREIVGARVRRKQASGVLTSDEVAEFVAPDGWVLATLGYLAEKLTDGTHKTPIYENKGVPFVSIKDFSAGRLDLSRTRFISVEENEVLRKRCDPRRGDILIGRIGTLGRAVVVNTDVEFSLFVSVGLIRVDSELISPDYLCLALNSPVVMNQFHQIKVGGGTHTNKLNLRDLHDVRVPLPPTEEQLRIVQRASDALKVCAELDAQLETANARRELLAEALLRRFLAPERVAV